jgi:hypothetical protein
MSWRTDKIIDVCIDLEDELPRAKRALVAARRSGRDRMFNAYVSIRRAKLEIARPILKVLDMASRNPRKSHPA